MFAQQLPNPGYVAMLSLGFAVIACVLALGQRLGDLRSKPLARVLVALGIGLLLCWIYLAALWLFMFDLRGFGERYKVFWIISVSLTGFTLVIRRVAPSAFAKVPMAFKTSKSAHGIEYVGWLGGSTLSAPKVFGGEATLIEVKNAAVAIPVTATDVVASLLYESDSGTRFTVSNAKWLEIHRHGTAVTKQWANSIASMEGGESQYFALWVDREGARMGLHRDDGWPIGAIDFGHWVVTIKVTSANFYGFEATLGFTFASDGFYRDDPRRAVAIRRRLPPRFP
jgi:hypothetical protein